jgi:hypothetical protein
MAHEAELFESSEPGGFRLIEGTVLRPRRCPIEGCPNSVSYRTVDEGCKKAVFFDTTCTAHRPPDTGEVHVWSRNAEGLT